MGRSPEAKQRRRQREKQRRARMREEGRHSQNGKPCTYCARPMSVECGALYPTKDHVEPRSMGGKITVWACYTCNHVKRDMSVDEWAIHRASHDEWWLTGRRAKAAANWTPRAAPSIICHPCQAKPDPKPKALKPRSPPEGRYKTTGSRLRRGRTRLEPGILSAMDPAPFFDEASHGVILRQS